MQKILPKGVILIPDTAKRVFKGVLFDVYQWPQELFDGNSTTFEMLKRSDTVQIIAIKDDKLVVIYDHQPYFGERHKFPTGEVNGEDKTWLVAAQRELAEECGLHFRQHRLIDVRQPYQNIEWLHATYLMWDLEYETPVKPSAGEEIRTTTVAFEAVRKEIMAGTSDLVYENYLFESLHSLEYLRNLPEFEGKSVNR